MSFSGFDNEDRIIEALIKRFLIEGVQSNSSAEFVYYGTAQSGVCCKSDKIVDWIANNRSRGAIANI